MLITCANHCGSGMSVTQDRYLDVIEQLAKHHATCINGKKHNWVEQSLEKGGNNERSTE